MPIYIGTTKIFIPGMSKVYVGSTLVYEDSQSPTWPFSIDVFSYATEHNWQISGIYNLMYTGYGEVTVANGDSRYTINGWTFYVNLSPELYINAAPGFIVKSFAITYTATSAAYLCFMDEYHQINSGEVVTITNQQQGNLLVFPDSSGGNGQVRITNIAVTYALDPNLSIVSLSTTNPNQHIQYTDFYWDGNVTVTLSDSNSYLVNEYCGYSGYDMSSATTQTVTITYGPASTTGTLTVIPDYINHISLENYTYLYDINDTFSFDGNVIAHYASGRTEAITSGYNVDSSQVDMTTVGTYQVTVYYQGYSASYSITVQAPTPTTTVITNIVTYATANGWVNGQKYLQVIMDTNLVADVVRAGSTSGAYNLATQQWRIYQSDSGGVTFTTTSGTIKSVKVTYASSNYGQLKETTRNVVFPSGTAVDTSGWNTNYVTLMVTKSQGTGTNGQAKITEMEITYGS